MTDPLEGPGIRIAQIYLENASFRHKEGHIGLTHTASPEIGQLHVQLEAGFTADQRRALVRVRVSTDPEGEGLYSFDLTMVALLRTDDRQPNMPLEKYVTIAGSTLLYPFLREAVANLTTRGRFGPVWLAPFNIHGAWEKTKTEPREPSGVKAIPEAPNTKPKAARPRKRRKGTPRA